ncbi:hypothetical protein [Myxococcus sp. CA056]|uniref:hypothetical protein n=1 Tax=Myxococcus sp. CA056 TaxID=2741740 RepID=UPI001C2D559E|nr:hypothetical protein [Myxococcus sp. CA056]
MLDEDTPRVARVRAKLREIPHREVIVRPLRQALDEFLNPGGVSSIDPGTETPEECTHSA